MADDPSLDFNVDTGADIGGWDHVLQSINDLFATRFGERVMREFYGSIVPNFLGENLTTETVVRFFSAVSSAIEIWEPRYRIVHVIPTGVGRDGRLQVITEGAYRPRALLGDNTVAGNRRITVLGSSGNRTAVIG